MSACSSSTVTLICQRLVFATTAILAHCPRRWHNNRTKLDQRAIVAHGPRRWPNSIATLAPRAVFTTVCISENTRTARVYDCYFNYVCKVICKPNIMAGYCAYIISVSNNLLYNFRMEMLIC